MLSDLRYVLRSLARSKSFTAVIVLTLALGIGSGAAIFSVVDWVLFRSLAFPDDLVLVASRSAQGQLIPTRSGAEIRAYRELTSTFAEQGLGRVQPVNVAIGPEPVASFVAELAPNLLSMLGIRPALGRGFLPEEATEGRSNVVLISHHFWQQHFGGAPDVLGREIVVDRTVCTIVGVLPHAQALPAYLNQMVFRPVSLPAAGPAPREFYFLFARLRPGVTLDHAAAAVSAAPVDLPENLARWRGEAKPAIATMAELQKIMRPEIYWVMVAAVGFLYSIACLNATNLMLVRLLGRRREISIRLALGGGRARLIRLLVLEGIAVSLLACIVGALLANWMMPLLMSLSLGDTRIEWTKQTLDHRKLLVLLALTVLTCLVIVLVPALRIVRAGVLDGLKSGGTTLGESPGVRRLRSSLIVLQAAFAVVLLTGTGLLVRTMHRLQAVPVGFDAAGAIKLSVSFPATYSRDNVARRTLLDRLREHLQRVPGVASVAFSSDALIAGYYNANTTVIAPDREPVKAQVALVSEDFFSTSGIHFKRGRMLVPTVSEVIVNESFARAMFGDEDPIGQVVKPSSDAEKPGGWTIVGIVGDIRDTVRSAPGNYIYASHTWYSPRVDMFVVRATQSADTALAAALKRAVYAFDPQIVVPIAAPLEEVRGWQLFHERYALSVLRVLSAMALLLTVIGLFSVLAYAVDQRMGEFGIRLALGATPQNLVSLVLRRGVILASAGILAGLAGAAALARYLQSLLFETPAHDPFVLASVTVILLAAATLACLLPARRASKVDVSQLLRSQ